MSLKKNKQLISLKKKYWRAIELNDKQNKKEFICIICPNSCRLTIWQNNDDEIQIEGYQCLRGKTYGIAEYTNPTRMIITTMKINNGILPIIPVRSQFPISKYDIKKIMKIINKTECQAPIKMGDILIGNIIESGIDIIASRDLKKKD